MTKTDAESQSLRTALGGVAGPGTDADRAALPEGFCGDIDMRIARDGTWFYQGTPIGRKPLVKLFATILSRDEAGDYWLTTPVERARIQVEDAPFLAVEMRVEGAGEGQRLSFRTNVDDWIDAGPEHAIVPRPRPQSGELAPYLHVRGHLDALIARAVYYDLVALGVEREDGGAEEFGVWSGGVFFSLAAGTG
jgi:uncharacterized protein